MKPRKELNRCLNPVSLPRYDGFTFRCGKCPACLKHAGAMLAVRVYNEGISTKLCHWITLTYRNEDCPIVEKWSYVDTETGEVLEESPLRYVDSQQDFFDNAPFVWRCNRKNKRVKRYFPLVREFPIVDLSGRYIARQEMYFSLRMKDFQDLMKRFRHSLDDSEKESFKYLAVPEYGGVGYRPHIHLVVVGLPWSRFAPFVKQWSELYGENYDVESIDFSKGSASENVGKVSAYVSKYASKGKFDCPFIASGNCKRPRRCSSVSFGCGSDDVWKSIKSQLLAFDVYGEYDPWDPPFSVDPKFLSTRRYCCIGEYPFPCPRLYVDKVFRKRKKVPKGSSIYFFSDLRHHCQKVFRFDRRSRDLDGNIVYVSSLIPRVDYVADITTDSIVIAFCVHYQKETRYYTRSSPLQEKITAVVFDGLRQSAARELESFGRKVKDIGFARASSECDNTERMYRYDFIRQFSADLEASLF